MFYLCKPSTYKYQPPFYSVAYTYWTVHRTPSKSRSFYPFSREKSQRLEDQNTSNLLLIHLKRAEQFSPNAQNVTKWSLQIFIRIFYWLTYFYMYFQRGPPRVSASNGAWSVRWLGHIMSSRCRFSRAKNTAVHKQTKFMILTRKINLGRNQTQMLHVWITYLPTLCEKWPDSRANGR